MSPVTSCTRFLGVAFAALVGCSLQHPATTSDVPRDLTDATDEPDALDADVPVIPDADVPVTPDADVPVPDDADVPVTLDADVEDVPVAPDADVLDADVPVTPDADVPVTPDADVPVTPDADVPVAPDADVPVAPDADVPDACVGATCVYASCAELPAGSASGVYNLRTFSGGTWRGYCEVTADSSPAWTLVMKVDGAQTTFQYDAVHWYTGSRYNDATVDPSEVEAKYEGFNSTAFREVRLQTSTAGSGRRDVVISMAPAALPAVSLASVMQMRSTPPMFITGTSAWATAFPGATLQATCTRFGFNVNPQPGGIFARVRIGGVGDESDPGCSSPDSWVGVGGFVNNPMCTPLGNTVSAGNVDGCNGAAPRRVASFVWIWVR